MDPDSAVPDEHPVRSFGDTPPGIERPNTSFRAYRDLGPPMLHSFMDTKFDRVLINILWVKIALLMVWYKSY